MRKLLVSAMAGATGLLAALPAQAQEYYLGQVVLYANSFCTKGMIEAAGQILPIQQYAALFSLYGTQFGGNGTTNFALPDLRGRAANNWGQGPGLQPYVVGEVGGAESVSLNILNLPMHTHVATMHAYAGNPNTDSPEGASFADFPNGVNIYNNNQAPNVDMAPLTAQTGIAGSNIPVPLHSPYLVLRYCVVMSGIFPSRP